ncbi:MAG: BON domain-containing protein [Deltaproteobacteria bacterium]|nr:BON domain-containing protein [Kofleriaceae bacterium]
MAISHMDRNEEREGRWGRERDRGGWGMESQRGGERELDERYRQRYGGEERDRGGWRDEDDGDRERRFGRFGRMDEDRGRDDERMRYQGWGGQSGSGSGMMTGRYGGGGQEDWGREQQMGYGRGGMGGGGYERGGGRYGESTGYGYGGGYGGQQMGMGGQRHGGQSMYGDEPYGGRGQQYGRGQYGRERMGGFRGKGPSGYTRSDERIREDVNDALTEDDEVDASSIEVQVKNGEVTLSGTVTERRMKRAAEDCVERIPGVKDVTNHIRVQEQREMSGNGGRQTSQSASSSSERDTESSKRPRA